MNASSFSAVGDQLEGFLSNQFTPPDGTQAVLGFFGSGLAVEPSSFIGADGNYNPARVNTWLNISLDVISAIQDHQVGSAVMSATQLMQAIGGSAMSTSPIGSQIALVLARTKSQMMEELGGATVIQAVPLNWYDPTTVAQWPNYGMKIGADAPVPTPSSNPGSERPTTGHPAAPLGVAEFGPCQAGDLHPRPSTTYRAASTSDSHDAPGTLVGIECVAGDAFTVSKQSGAERQCCAPGHPKLRDATSHFGPTPGERDCPRHSDGTASAERAYDR